MVDEDDEEDWEVESGIIRFEVCDSDEMTKGNVYFGVKIEALCELKLVLW